MTDQNLPGSTEDIGFIGIGVMGLSMARNLQRAGYKLTVYTRTRAKAEPLLADGASWAESPEAVAREAGLVITIVGDPADVESTYLGESGLMKGARAGSIFIDMTTSSPALAERLDTVASESGCACLDAPVSGGDIGARDGTLSIMVGGPETAYESALPVLQVLGRNIVHQGPAGSGQHTKMCNQIAIASGMLGIVEALAYAKASGLEPEQVLKSISGGAAASWSLSNLAPRILKDDFAPGFAVHHFLKDMRIALQSADEMGLQLPGLDLARQSYERLAALGRGDEGTQALFRLYS